MLFVRYILIGVHLRKNVKFRENFLSNLKKKFSQSLSFFRENLFSKRKQDGEVFEKKIKEISLNKNAKTP